jgi:hypothetical protein
MSQESIIEKLKLSEKDVLTIVMEWYTNGMCPEILQTEDGEDLEEVLENMIYCCQTT